MPTILHIGINGITKESVSRPGTHWRRAELIKVGLQDGAPMDHAGSLRRAVRARTCRAGTVHRQALCDIPSGAQAGDRPGTNWSSERAQRHDSRRNCDRMSGRNRGGRRGDPHACRDCIAHSDDMVPCRSDCEPYFCRDTVTGMRRICRDNRAVAVMCGGLFGKCNVCGLARRPGNAITAEMRGIM